VTWISDGLFAGNPRDENGDMPRVHARTGKSKSEMRGSFAALRMTTTAKATARTTARTTAKATARTTAKATARATATIAKATADFSTALLTMRP
jgi:hypothetical protein